MNIDYPLCECSARVHRTFIYRPENERDYGKESLEILLQVMETQRDDLVVIPAGYADRMEIFFRDNPGLREKQPRFANARSIRKALDRARLRQANRVFA